MQHRAQLQGLRTLHCIVKSLNSFIVGDPEITISLSQSFECAVIRTKPQLPLLA